MDSFSTYTDEEIVEKCSVDTSFLTELISRYESKLDIYIYRKSGASQEDRQDLLQDIFIKVYKNIKDFDSSLKFSSWIYRIAHNEMIDWYRKKKRRPTVYFEENTEIVQRLASEIDIVKDLVSKERLEDIQEEIKKLSTDYQEIIQLRFFEEKSYDEISDILKIPPGTVATRINRAKKKLQETLKKYV